ncbi:ammonia-forming cytochrome c nitrite reductase subunit c552 [uncultured Anaerococcus sp.]|uniref:ammonia-forming cytochrome c nitrite reductase subunit c552 n=1 Tax=uncultured Anaerococcus sp. TaxID=293428 RepID=UPI0028899B08|nr:ammonia-forming cytochrome c nitrite reductase subunit c552 [uncultured Anaerococcus sp.]
MNKKIITTLSAFIMAISLSSCGKNMEFKTAEDYKDTYPDVYATYKANEDMSETKFGGSVQVDYLESHPNLRTYYEGYCFAKQYDRARGHVYALEDALNTKRPKPGASCLACKTMDFVAALEKDGIDVNSIDFDQFVKDHPKMQTISCADCHLDDPGKIQVTRDHFKKQIDEGNVNSNNAKVDSLACAQCHVEYYLDPETKEVVLPYKYGFETDDMLKYYDEIDFADWEHPQTGAKLLKAQHPEFETMMGSVHDSAGLSCIDCHMPLVENEKGEKFRSHHWTSPLKSKDGIKNACLSCHAGKSEDEMIAWVEEVQQGVSDRTNEVSDELKAFIDLLAKHVKAGDLSNEDKAELQKIHRYAQFKWDFVWVENGEGFHNSKKAHQNLDEAEKLVKQGLEILKKYE